ncbi:MAG: hypothetical protein VXZ39_09360, partial [Planctomycetota bacterium]|nr:hypothetical protein [Planctomycetota bacterium]
MNVQRRIPNPFHDPDVQEQPARRRLAAVVARDVSEERDTEQSESLERLEELLVTQEQCFGEVMASNAQFAIEIARLKEQLRQADGRLAAAEDAREALKSALEERDEHVAELESRLLPLAIADADARRKRGRML